MRISFSQCSDFIKCPKLWYWKHVAKLFPASLPEYYQQGSDFHKGIEGKELPDSIYGKIGIIASNFFDPPMDREIRKEIFLDSSQKDSVVCIADGLSADSIIEYKTTSRATADYIHSQVMSLQSRLYGFVFDKRFLKLRICKKYQIRQKQNESDSQFVERILTEYTEKPNEYFQEVVTLIDDPVKAVYELRHIVKMITSCLAANQFPLAAPYGCYTFSACQYLPLCSDFETNKILFRGETDAKN